MSMSKNMEIYERVRSVPKEAQKQFNNGKFSGTDINPMWRIKKLTELFGPCGIGWWTEDVRYWLEPGSDGHVAAFCSLSLRFVLDGKTSQPVHGIGGNVFVRKNNTSDEAYKMAYTDALSIAAKALGVGADIWFSNDKSKYEKQAEVSNFDDQDGDRNADVAANEQKEAMQEKTHLLGLFKEMRNAKTVKELMSIFGPAWNKADGSDKLAIESEFKRLKATMENKNV